MHSACFFKSLEIFIILSNSSSDSILIENIPALMASLISSSVLPTPEKTISSGFAPASKHLLSSLPETTSKPLPSPESNDRM